MPLVRRRPLLRAAAVGGGAYLAGKRSSAAQGGGEPEPQAASAPASGLSAEDTTRLAELGRLHDEGVLTDAEFSAQKSKILGSG
jgi:hypothetical protein